MTTTGGTAALTSLAGGSIADPAGGLLPYADMTTHIEAAYITDHPGLIGWEQRDGGRTALKGPRDYDGDAGTRAITLAVTDGENDPGKYKEIDHYIRHRMRQTPGVNHRNKHSPWPIRADTLHQLTGMTLAYEWKKGHGQQPTLTEAAERFGDGIAPIPRTRARLFGAAYISAARMVAYDIYDPRLYPYPKQGGYEDNPPAAQTAEGIDLFDPADYMIRERRVRFYYAHPQGCR